MNEHDVHPESGKSVIILLNDGSVHTGHFIKNANYKETNVNRWRLYSNQKKGKTVADEEVVDWLATECIASNWDYLKNEQDKVASMIADIIAHKMLNLVNAKEVANG